MEFYDILILAELYNIPELSDELHIQMENIPLSMNNLIEVAFAASKFSQCSQFEQISKSVLNSCAKFLQKEDKNPVDKLELILTEGGNGMADIAIELLELVKQLPPRSMCYDCREESCMVVQNVPHVKMRPGLHMKMVAYYPEAHANNSCHGKNTEVTVKGVASNGQVMVSGLRGNKEFTYNYNSCWESEKGAVKMTFVFDC